MNILYLADPNSIHDLKWITFFFKKAQYKTFILPRPHHYIQFQRTGNQIEIKVLTPIHDFSILRFYQTLADAWRIKRIIKRNKIDLIHILYAEPNALWCLFRNYFQIPMIISCRGTDVLYTIPETIKNKTLINYIVGPAYKNAFLLADMVTGTSHSQLKSIKKFANRKNHMKLVRTGIDISQQYSSISEVNFPKEINNKSYILFPRSIKPIYNHEFCIEAIKLLPTEIKQSYLMVFVGKNSGDMHYQKKIERMMRSVPDANILLLDKQSQVTFHELIKGSSLVVMTPKSDGSPVSAIEAMYFGKPLIIGPIEYDEDLFDEKVIKLNSWSASELAEKISRTLVEGDIYIDYLLNSIALTYNMNIMDEVYNTLTC